MMKKAKINDNIYNVISEEEFSCDTAGINERFTAVEHDGYVYPIKQKTDSDIGVCSCGAIIKYTQPVTSDDREAYSSSNIINFSAASTLREVIEKTDQLRSAERTILTKADNIFQANIGPNDSPAMRGLKEAVNDKHIDLDKYGPRFGTDGKDYHNAKRLLSSDDITLHKIINFSNNLDIRVTLRLEDKSPDIPNPIGHVIEVELNSNGESEDDDN